MGFDVNGCEARLLPSHSLMLSLSKYEDGNAGSIYSIEAQTLPSSYFDRPSMRAKGWVCSLVTRIQGLAMLRVRHAEAPHD